MGKQKIAKPLIRKRAFLLLELLISLSLITLCLFPLIKPHASMRVADRKNLEEMQFERVVQEAFCSLKQKLYENQQHTWERLKKGTTGELSKSFSIASDKVNQKKYTCSYTIRKLDNVKKSGHKKEGLVIEIDFHFSPNPIFISKEPHFQRTLYLERHAV